MFVIIGLVVVFGSILAGYTMHHGNLAVLVQPTEFIIIVGAAIGSLLIANPLHLTMGVIKGVLGTLSGSKIKKETYVEVLKMLYELFQLAKKEGLIALEQHIENPSGSPIVSKYPSFLANHHATEFTCDTLKIVLNGGVPAHDLEDLMELDLETSHHEHSQLPTALSTVGDAFPGLGIVAAVLGVIITMGEIDKPPEVIGMSVAAALVGTFLGVLMSYGVVGPLAKNMEHMVAADHRYLVCIKAAILAFAKGAPSVVAVEYGRRAIESHDRPSFQETEEAVKSVK